jgi:hypothetical protein
MSPEKASICDSSSETTSLSVSERNFGTFDAW